MRGKQGISIFGDDSLYPKDPYTISTPPFSNPTTLLRFVGDGKKGLLDYCKAISTMPTMESTMMHIKSMTSNNLKTECKLQEEKIKAQQQEIERLNK